MSSARPSPLDAAMARLLATSWREHPTLPPEQLRGDLPRIVDKLLGTGGGALGWWRLRGSPLETAAGSERFREAFRLHTLQAALHTKNLESILVHFNAAGLTPLLFKGWSVARLYGSVGLRPYGDFDLLVDVEDEGCARAVIAALPSELQALVDLDMRVLNRFLPDRRFADVAARASSAAVGAGRFRALAPEDHFRVICLHQLDHGAWRPLWLCDVAAFVEALPADFSWNRCLAGNPRLSDAVLALVALAEELLEARLPRGTPPAVAPNWFRKAVLRGWAGGFQAAPDSLHHLHQLGWRRALAAVRARWPDPVTSTLHLRAPMSVLPRPLLQVAECARRAFLFLRHAVA